MTMNGSLPPSSSTVFLRCLPAIDATLRPAPSLPVSVAAATRGSASTPATASLPTSSVWNTPSGRAGAAHERLQLQRALRHVGRVLQQPDVAGHERRAP